MTYEVQDEYLKTMIKHKAIKNGIHEGECFVRYDGSMYLVDFDRDVVVLQYKVNGV